MSEENKTAATHAINRPVDLSVDGAMDAPIIFFDEVPAIGTFGVGRVLLTAVVHDVAADGAVTVRRKAVAQLRGTPAAFDALRSAINRMEQIVTPPSGPKN
ncbi:hypothetical protein [Methylobacterium oxalidis]|uniref:hypothetical protein n=1 Tax=Methylobacterium oxalidis TaxID=944322 RepID=UPI0033148EED